MYEIMKTRHTTMVIGPTGGGKSVIIKTLRDAQTIMGFPTKIFTINAKVNSSSFCGNEVVWSHGSADS